MRALLQACTDRLDAMLDELELLVVHETPTGDVHRLDSLALVLAEQWQAVGGHVTRHEVPGAGTHLGVRWPGPRGTPAGVPPALIIGHYDTVHDPGTLVRNPFRVESGRVWGPGSQDMKAGLVIARHAVAVLAERAAPLPRPVTVLITCDEEVGSTTSSSLVRECAESSAHAFVLEPAAPGGALKTARKGVGLWTLMVRGVAAHAGQHFEDGRSANLALARLVSEVSALTDLDAGTTVNVGVMRGGTRANVVAEHAEAIVDVRFSDDAEAQRITEALAGLRPEQGTTLDVRGGINRPAMPRTRDTARLFEQARRCAEDLGFALDEVAGGGASDGNITAAAGAPTLDGLGAVGAGLHTDEEYAEVAELPRRTALLACLLTSL